MQNNDKVGVLFFTDRPERFIPPKKGRGHILYIIRELLDFEPQGSRTDIGAAVEYLTRVMTKRCISFLISDFIDRSDYSRPMMIAARKHDLVGIRVADRRAAELPAVGLIKAEDPETGHECYIDTDSRRVREQYAKGWRQLREKGDEQMRRCGVDHTTVMTDEDYVRPLKKLLGGR